MTKEEFAALITGREYRKEITRAEAAQAKAAGLLVIYGASDDLLEFDGAFRDELGAYNGTTARFHAGGTLPAWEDLDKDDESEAEAYFVHKAKACTVTASWDTDGYSWVISTDLPHATFEVLDDGEKYCRGIVVSVTDLALKTVSASQPATVGE